MAAGILAAAPPRPPQKRAASVAQKQGLLPEIAREVRFPDVADARVGAETDARPALLTPVCRRLAALAPAARSAYEVRAALV